MWFHWMVTLYSNIVVSKWFYRGMALSLKLVQYYYILYIMLRLYYIFIYIYQDYKVNFYEFNIILRLAALFIFNHPFQNVNYEISKI